MEMKSRKKSEIWWRRCFRRRRRRSVLGRTTGTPWRSTGWELRHAESATALTDCGCRRRIGEDSGQPQYAGSQLSGGMSLRSQLDRKLLRQIGETLGKECQARGVQVLLGPGVNIKRSPLCGRNFEYFSRIRCWRRDGFRLCTGHSERGCGRLHEALSGQQPGDQAYHHLLRGG